MRLYVELAKKSFQRQVTYRGATLAGFVTNLFFGIIRVAVFVAVFGARPAVAGYSLPDAVTYTGLTQALIAFTALWGWMDMVRSIRTGEVASDLMRPFDYYGFWLSQDAGRALYQLITRGGMIMLAFALIYGIVLPTSATQWLLVALTVAAAWFLSFTWRFLASTTGFWATDASGIVRLLFFVMILPCGFLVPIAFMPSWLAALCYATPFPGIVDIPVTIFLGHATGAVALSLIARQLAWGVALLAAGRLAADAGRRRLTVQGG